MAAPTSTNLNTQHHPVESWDDDHDFDGDLFANPLAATQSSFSASSRASVSARSESMTGDDDWQVLLAPDDHTSTQNAISSAKLAGIPIPTDVPSSALLGGAIKRLGKKPSRQKIRADDDWGDDLELPGSSSEALKLKTPRLPSTPALHHDDDDDFDDWAEGSLGIRFAGTKRDTRNRSSSMSASAMSPSMGSCMTLESEDDDLVGLVLPKQPIDFNAMLRKRQEAESQKLPPPEEIPLPEVEKEQEELTAAPESHQQQPQQEPEREPERRPMPPPLATPFATPAVEEEDFFADLDISPTEVLDTKKLTLNRNVKVNNQKQQLPPPQARSSTTLTFTDKPTVSRIPRPLGGAPTRSRLDPVYESGASQVTRHTRGAPTTTNAQLLRAKRSAPVLRSDYRPTAKQPPVPFLPAGSTSSQSHHIKSKGSQGHLRRDSDPHRASSPTPRALSRLAPRHPSAGSRRKDIAPEALSREAAAKRMFTKPARKRNFGDGTELEIFDDLPTSAAKESKYMKQPANRPPSKQLKHQHSQSKLPIPERMQTPLPPSPHKENTPRFARDTAASRIAREQRLAGTRSRGEGPLMPVAANWKAQIAARSPHTSPTSMRKKRTSGLQPFLIKQMNAPAVKSMSSHYPSALQATNRPQDEKGMTYNPTLQRWEGNEESLLPFSSPIHPPISRAVSHSHSHSQPVLPTNTNTNNPLRHSHNLSDRTNPPIFNPSASQPVAAPSPPRAPALISHFSTARGVQVERGMVFDPRRMCWLKLDPSARNDSNGPLSPTISIDEDPFADIEDLRDDDDVKVGIGGAGSNSNVGGSVTGAPGQMDTVDVFVGEEFDLGPEFIRRQREEEDVWRRKVEGWVGSEREGLGEGWRWGFWDMCGQAMEGKGEGV
ncbi:hypothetical protein K490DRAFT_50567 [Saccharata proteae CBS 121410]|uniref:Cytokinesis regulator n=1 Tax=Saccharata proteae CBS 121410 TaxID=1314787 RepID=A0A9P4LWB9_9PEZI|nr:hypothetical protein K490DRAFT_50567 [Saccharata proteae CBS 121410]